MPNILPCMPCDQISSASFPVVISNGQMLYVCSRAGHCHHGLAVHKRWSPAENTVPCRRSGADATGAGPAADAQTTTDDDTAATKQS